MAEEKNELAGEIGGRICAKVAEKCSKKIFLLKILNTVLIKTVINMYSMIAKLVVF